MTDKQESFQGGSERCGVVGYPQSGRKVCELEKGHKDYHQQGSTHWLGYFKNWAGEEEPPPAPPASVESFQGMLERPMLDNWVAEFSITDESDVFDEFTLDDQAKIWGLMRIAWDTAASRQRQLLFTRLVELRDAMAHIPFCDGQEQADCALCRLTELIEGKGK